jgi:hypothetical protein
MYRCLIHSYIFRHFKKPSTGSPIWTCWDGAQCREKQRRMGAVYCDIRRNGRDMTGWRIPMGSFTQSYPNHYAVCHNVQLRSFSASYDIGHHLSMFMLESLMMEFWNAETCRSLLSINTLNEWCICWSFTYRKDNVLRWWFQMAAIRLGSRLLW